MEKIMLPVTEYRQKIMDVVTANSVVIITAETGAGKSTQVPQFLLEAGYNIVVTQPRRLAARTVAMRVAEERGEELGGTVGFRTAYERKDGADTKCLFVTDGLALVRELMGVGRHNVLVLDEVHEWNLNIEVLLAWSRRQIDGGAMFKVVVMSATLESEKLSKFFGNAPVIDVPGRLFPVKEEKPGNDIVTDAVDLLRQGRNVLVFQPGKSEIAETIRDLKDSGVHAEILSLHGEMTPEEQAKVFQHYGRPKCVVSTNVAQTSVTIDDIDAVVDSGMERRVELAGGVEGLYVKAISYADSDQRKGRAGRCKPGIYIDHCNAMDRLDFPKAEILRTRLDQTVLRLAEAGLNAEELQFFHQPPASQIHDARESLKALGCMDQNGVVTKIGHAVAKLPISVQFGRMVVEADKRGVVDDIVTVAAILEQGGITARPSAEERFAAPRWLKLCPGEESSDVMAQLMIYKAAKDMTKEQMKEAGIFVKAYFQAKEKRQHLADALRGKVKSFQSSGDRNEIIKAVCAGMAEHLFRGEYGMYRNGELQAFGGITRQLNRETVIKSAVWVVGEPWDLQIKTRMGPRTLHLIRMATKVDPSWLAEVAPQLAKEERYSPRFDAVSDTVVVNRRLQFNGQFVAEDVVADPGHPEAAMIFRKWLARQLVGE